MAPTQTDDERSGGSCAQAAGLQPSVHHRALLTWLAVYLTITAVQLLLGGRLAHLPVVVRTFVLTVVVVPVVVYLLVPVFVRWYTAIRRAVGARRC